MYDTLTQIYVVFAYVDAGIWFKKKRKQEPDIGVCVWVNTASVWSCVLRLDV